MPKKIKNCYYRNLTFKKLLAAHNRAKRHKTYKNEVIKFELDFVKSYENFPIRLVIGRKIISAEKS